MTWVGNQRHAVAVWLERVGMTGIHLSESPITILTKPSGTMRTLPRDLSQRLVPEIRSVAAVARASIKQREHIRKNWGGHPGVTESLIKGLRAQHVPVHLNPLVVDSKRDKVIGILGGRATFSWAMSQSHREPGFRFLVGPNAFEMPLDVGLECLNPAVVGLVAPCKWVQEFYASVLPAFDRPIHVWAAGVNEMYWTPAQEPVIGRSRGVLLYVKNQDSVVVAEAESVCRSAGFKVEKIVYGNYSQRQYLAALRRATVMVVLGRTESQGLALFEAWSAGVPTLVSRYKGFLGLTHHPERRIVIDDLSSSAPYLTEQTGMFWENSGELLNQLLSRDWEACKPRPWILANATMSISALKYAKIIRPSEAS